MWRKINKWYWGRKLDKIRNENRSKVDTFISSYRKFKPVEPRSLVRQIIVKVYR